MHCRGCLHAFLSAGVSLTGNPTCAWVIQGVIDSLDPRALPSWFKGSMWHCTASSSYCEGPAWYSQPHFSSPFNFPDSSKLIQSLLIYTVFDSTFDLIHWPKYIKFFIYAKHYSDIDDKQNRCSPGLLGVYSPVGSQTQLKVGLGSFLLTLLVPGYALSSETSLPASTDFFCFLPPVVSAFINIHFKYIHVPYFMCFVLSYIAS